MNDVVDLAEARKKRRAAQPDRYDRDAEIVVYLWTDESGHIEASQATWMDQPYAYDLHSTMGRLEMMRDAMWHSGWGDNGDELVWLATFHNNGASLNRYTADLFDGTNPAYAHWLWRRVWVMNRTLIRELVRLTLRCYWTEVKRLFRVKSKPASEAAPPA